MSDAASALRRLVRAGDTVLVGNGTSEPASLIAALIEIAPSLGAPVRVIQITTSGAEALAQASGPHLRLATPAPGPLTRKAIAEGRADLLPVSLGQMARQIASAALRVDGALVQSGPEAGDGTANPGLALDLAQSAFETARYRGVEINRALPRLASDFRYDLSACDVAVAADRPPVAEPPEPPLPTSAAIAEGIAACIPEGATLEAGLGRAGALLAKALAGRRGMALFTGLITDATMDLIESGAVDRPALPDRPALAVGAVVRGSERLYRWCDNNRAVLLADARLTHAPETMIRLPRFVALNGALQVDLMGNVNSLTIDGRMIGGLGGAIDYATAGAYAAGSIIALEAVRRGRSCIVPQVETVTIPGLFVTHIVTEHGVAALRGLSLAERAEAIVRIAAPEHRDALSAAARAAGA